ncbi:MAG: chemotaxis protein CheB [Terracidiphilus sp.]|nr:chemotaxis protein CheB [Terracidiphilus sp.]
MHFVAPDHFQIVAEHLSGPVNQDEASSVVFGMPKEAIKLNGVRKVLPLGQIPAAILTHGG